MEDDIRDLVHGSSPSSPAVVSSRKSRSLGRAASTSGATKSKSKSRRSKSPSSKKTKQSRSQSTTKLRKTKRSSTDKSKSTATTATKPSSSSTPPAGALTSMTLEIPIDNKKVRKSDDRNKVSAKDAPEKKLPVSKNLQDLLGSNDQMPVVAPVIIVAPEVKAAAAKTPSKTEEEEVEEEKKKRRERLMVSPFEFLNIYHAKQPVIKENADDHSLEFHDDVSYLTLPKVLRAPDEDKAGNKKKAVPKSVATADAPSSMEPGWSRKPKPDSAAADDNNNNDADKPSNDDKETTSQKPATRTKRRKSEGIPKSPKSPRKRNPQKDILPNGEPPMDTATLQEISGETAPKATKTSPAGRSRSSTPRHHPRHHRQTSDPMHSTAAVSAEAEVANPPIAPDQGRNSPTPANPGTDPNAATTPTPTSAEGTKQSSILQRLFQSRRRSLDDPNQAKDIEHGEVVDDTTSSGSPKSSYANSKRKSMETRRRFTYVAIVGTACFLFLVALAAVLSIVIALNKDDQKAAAPEYADTPITKADFKYDSPLEPVEPDIQTSEMAPIDFNCDHLDQVDPGSNGNPKFAHVYDQCQCDQVASYLPQDVIDMRNSLLDVVIPPIYGPLEDLDIPPASSCHPANQALLWLASGENRKVGYLMQRFILALFFFETYSLGTEWDFRDNWLSSNIECFWLGIECNNNDAVINISIDSNNIHGTVPTEFGLLGGLEGFYLSRNFMRGTIPTELISLSRLRELSLYRNEMNGPIPSVIGSATSLQSLLLHTNYFGGSLPTELGLATALTNLHLGFNQYGRSLPVELGQLTRLQYLTLNDNRLTGRLPPELGRMTSLQNVTLSKNLFEGSLPSEIGMLTQLQDLRINDNAGVGGTLPTELGLLSSNLRIVQMVRNSLRGLVPTEFGRLTSLESLQLYSNRLEGQLPTELGKMVSLEDLRLDDNALSGTIPSELGRLGFLEYLSLDRNGLQGSVPLEVCQKQGLALDTFVVDCPNAATGLGVECRLSADDDGCCSNCRPSD